MKYKIYYIKCLINNKYYFGRSQEFPKRKRSHLNALRKSKHSNYYLQKDFNKYGENNFIFIIIDECETLNESIIKEQEYIDNKNYNTYNISNSQNGGDTFTNNPRKEKIRKLKQIRFSGQNNPMYGIKKTQKMIDAVKKSNSHKVSINGKIYSSKTEASKDLNCCVSTICGKVKSKDPKYSNWFMI